MPGVAKVGDLIVAKKSKPTLVTGSADVFIEGKPAAKVGSLTTPQLEKKTLTVETGSPTVFVNDQPIARENDRMTKNSTIVRGSSSVFAD